MPGQRPIRVLYSFPHKLGADRICNTAWQLVNALAVAGADVTVFPGVLHKPLPASVKVHPTLAFGKLRVPYKAVGKIRALALHDRIVARRLEKLEGEFDVVHAWPMGALRTLKTATRLGIPTVLERPNAHTRFAYEIVQRECTKLGLTLPKTHEHFYNARILETEELEFRQADYLACPSDFVARTFLDQGFSVDKLVRHQYGFDEKVYYYDPHARKARSGLSVLFVGGCAPRKGVHYALEAWLRSSACRDGIFQIAGEFVPGYAEKLESMLAHPSVRVLGHRHDVADLMRQADILILPSIEEGSALVTAEARGSGCVLIVSEAAGAVCDHMKDALVHPVGDVKLLAKHLTLLHENRGLLDELRSRSLSTVHQITWNASGVRLLGVYREILRARASQPAENRLQPV